MEPLTLTGIAATTLVEGIKFLYGQAGELLKDRRQRKAAREPAGPVTASLVPLEAPFLEGRLEPLVADFSALEELVDQIQSLRRDLGDYAEGIEPVDTSNEDLLRLTDALRRSLEAVFGQQITFRGEHRPASSPLVEGRVDVEQVAGYVAAVRARVVTSGAVRGTAKTARVEPEGELIGVDVDQLGEDRQAGS